MYKLLWTRYSVASEVSTGRYKALNEEVAQNGSKSITKLPRDLTEAQQKLTLEVWGSVPRVNS